MFKKVFPEIPCHGCPLNNNNKYRNNNRTDTIIPFEKKREQILSYSKYL